MKKTMLKALCLLTAALMLAAAIPFTAAAKTVPDSRDIWDGSVAGSFAGGTGTEANPYLIANGAQLALLARMVNTGNNCSGKYFALSDDILLNDTSDWEDWILMNAPANTWTQIGSAPTSYDSNGMAFCGNFDGRGHSVLGLYTSSENNTGALFGYAQGAEITSLTVAQSFVNAQYYAAGIAVAAAQTAFSDCCFGGNVYAVCAPGRSEGTGGIAAAAAGCTFTGCSCSGMLMGLYSQNVGGIVGDSTACVVTNCSMSGSTDCLNCFYVGGIVGHASEGRIEACVLEGEISVRSSFDTGGVVGKAECAVIGCVNRGSVLGNDSTGGIVGELNAYITEAYVENCRNEGSVQGSGSLGGIVGEMLTGTIASCVNNGPVLLSVPSGNSSYVYAGGINGVCRGTIEDCENNGPVSTENGNYECFICGIAGQGQPSSTIQNCRNNGTVSSADQVSIAGIVCEGRGTVLNCINNGAVTGENSLCAGIACTNWVLIDNCENNGPVTGGTVSGIAADNNGGTISRCVNRGSISGETATGILIYAYNESVIENCYNTGAVSGAANAAGIVFRHTGNTAEYCCYNAGAVNGENAAPLVCEAYDENELMVNCYYLDTCCENGSEYGTALTDEQLRNTENYEGFDFETVWTMEGDPSYPYAELIGQWHGQETLPGDVDGDGEVTVADALLALRASMGLVELNDEQQAAANVDGDEEITVADALMILRASMGLLEL